MPPQQQNSKKFSGIEAASIIGFAACMDLFQGIGQWAITFLIGALGTALTLGFGAAPSIALGIAMGAGFSLFMSTVTGTILAMWFHFKGVPFAVKIGSSALFEMVPYLSTLPAWTFAATTTVMSANGTGFGKILGGALALVGGGAVAANKFSGTKQARAFTMQRPPHEDGKETSPLPQKELRSSPPLVDGMRSVKNRPYNAIVPPVSKAA